MILKYIAFLLILTICGHAAEPLLEKESVLIYCDDAYKGVFKDMKSQFKDTLSAKKVSWKVTSEKNSGFVALAENMEKELLKSKADRYVIALGYSEFWDSKEKQAKTLDAALFTSSIDKIITALKSEHKKIVICTPHQILAGKEPAANDALAAAAEIIRFSAKKADVECADFYSAFETMNGGGDDGGRMKGISTKDGYKLNDAGESIIKALVSQSLSLSETAMTRNLKEGDIIMLAGPFGPQLMVSFSSKLSAHYKESMKFLSPRAIGVSLSEDLFAAKLYNLDKMKINKPTILFIYPGQSILGKKTRLGSLDDGIFKTQLKGHLETLRSEIPDAVMFVCTPLIWRENDDANLVVIDGENFKTCEKWALQTREIAEELGIPVLDLHKKCLEFINTNGVEKAFFAGQGSKATYYRDLDATAGDFLLQAIAQAINFNDYSNE